MALSIESDEADRLARELAELTGESLTEVVLQALRERLERQQAHRGQKPLADVLTSIGRRCSGRPSHDDRPAEEILGYDEHGLPG